MILLSRYPVHFFFARQLLNDTIDIAWLAFFIAHGIGNRYGDTRDNNIWL